MVCTVMTEKMCPFTKPHSFLLFCTQLLSSLHKILDKLSTEQHVTAHHSTAQHSTDVADKSRVVKQWRIMNEHAKHAGEARQLCSQGSLQLKADPCIWPQAGEQYACCQP